MGLKRINDEINVTVNVLELEIIKNQDKMENNDPSTYNTKWIAYNQ
ncbi:hypothetical protein [Flavobacterium polysaccharolyticum]|uniref:Uncharacterized protein n=1 Tax=Flavobacterium polysaccharolyticum TaxID=3133148 RepID=A0ABU9NUB1_9FLAO